VFECSVSFCIRNLSHVDTHLVVVVVLVVGPWGDALQYAQERFHWNEIWQYCFSSKCIG